MHTLSIPLAIMASINLYVGVYYLFFYIERPQIREHLPFALLCFSVGLYQITSAGLYNSSSLPVGVFWQRIQLDSVAAIIIFSLWFTNIFTEQKSQRTLQLSIAWFGIFLVLSFLAGPALTLSTATPAIKDVHFFNLLKIRYYESSVGILYRVEIVSAIFAFIYILFLYIGYYRKTKKKILLFVISCELTYFIGVASDSMVAMQVYRFVYVSEYPFFLMVVSMAYTLLDRFVDFHKAYEELNANLELKVEQRTHEIMEAQASIKTLGGLIPICSNCKKIRDDKGYWEQLEQYIHNHSGAEFSHGICPECAKKLYPEYFPDLESDVKDKEVPSS
ncbi:MAG: hypothetical protein M1469_05435 [Bacteroidetes bacterium]|nr:hypothetical protein [Bacteroidota bacterium]